MDSLDISKYSNHLEYLNLTYSSIEKEIKQYTLKFYATRNYKAEWKMKFPTFLYSFYRFIYQNAKIPTQEEFYTYYLRQNSEWFSSHKIDAHIIIGLKARLFRTYPSLVRDIHFSKFLEENLSVLKVIYNTHLDVEEGIDLLIQTKGKNYGVNLFTQTNGAFIGRSRKANRHKTYANIQYVDLPVAFKGSSRCGEFFLYGQREILSLKNEIIY